MVYSLVVIIQLFATFSSRKICILLFAVILTLPLYMFVVATPWIAYQPEIAFPICYISIFLYWATWVKISVFVDWVNHTKHYNGNHNDTNANDDDGPNETNNDENNCTADAFETKNETEFTTVQSCSVVIHILYLASHAFIYWNERRAAIHMNDSRDEGQRDIGIELWILRIVGFLWLVFSASMMLQPLATLLDITLPRLDWDSARWMAVVFALPNYVFIVSSAWLAYRPAIVTPIWFFSLQIYMIIVSTFFILIIGMKIKKRHTNGNNNDTNENKFKYLVPEVRKRRNADAPQHGAQNILGVTSLFIH